jgi:hypothetical protein
MRVAAVRTAQHLDAHQPAGAAVVGDFQHRLHLNHGFTFRSRILENAELPGQSRLAIRRLLRSLDHRDQSPSLGLGSGSALLDSHQIALMALITAHRGRAAWWCGECTCRKQDV